MLAHCLRRWSNIETTLDQRLMYAGGIVFALKVDARALTRGRPVNVGVQHKAHYYDYSCINNIAQSDEEESS